MGSKLKLQIITPDTESAQPCDRMMGLTINFSETVTTYGAWYTNLGSLFNVSRNAVDNII
jgi:hypothetical protein